MKGLGEAHVSTKWRCVEFRDEGVTKGVMLVKPYLVLEIEESIMEPIISL